MAPILPSQNIMEQHVSCCTTEKWDCSGMALHCLHNHSPSQHPETLLIKSTGKKKVHVYSCLIPQTRTWFWRGECLIWCGHSYTINFMWGILTSPQDEPIRNSNRGNWGRSFFLDPPFIAILLARIYLNIDAVSVGLRQNMLWIKHIQEDEVLSCSKMFTAALILQKSNTHA